MAQIATTTASDPLGVPANTRVDRDPATGYLYALVRSTTANTWDLYRSINGGTTWALHLSLLRSGIQEMGSTFIANDGHLYLSYRTNESGQDRIYFRRCRLNNPVWGPETLTGNPAHGGTAGAIHQGMDIQLVGGTAGRYMRIVICVGTTFGSTSGITLYGVLLDQPAGTHKYTNSFLTGKRQWMDITGTHRIVPSVDIEHTGDGKSADTPHLWISYGRTELRMVKLSWTGAGWSGPATTQLLQSGLAAQDGIVGRWDGERWLTVVPHPTATDTVLAVERDRGNTTSTLRQTPAHPAGVVRTVGLSYSRTIGRTATAATRVYAVGTANPDLHFVDFVRETGTWTSWTTVTSTDVLGTPPAQFSVRRGSVGYARHDLAIGHAGSPNLVTSYHQTVTYAPDTPSWDVTAIGVNNGAAAEVSSPLNLTWVFSDPDPNDTQSAWALSRQIGTDSLAYFRASDSTWQATEQKNAGATTSRSLAAGWGSTADASHSYKVKVWDGSDTASLYSDAFVVLPSGKVNPTITAPTAAQVLTQDRVTVSWTVAEQTAFRVQLKILAEVVFDSGWVAGTVTTYTPDFALGDNFGYTVTVQTRNLEGLVSDEQSRDFSVDFIEPATATLVTTPLAASGVIRVAITNPTPVGTQPAVASVDLYRRPISSPFLLTADFEPTDPSTWTNNGGTGGKVNTISHQGSWSYQMQSDGSDPIGMHMESVKLPCTPGLTYFGDMWMNGSHSSKDLFAQFRWYNGAAQVGTDIGFQKPPPAAGAWDFRWCSATAPADATHMTICGVLGLPSSGDFLRVDEVRLRVNDPNEGVRIAQGLTAGATYDDWRAVSGVAYEYRAQTRSVIGTSVGGVWTA